MKARSVSTYDANTHRVEQSERFGNVLIVNLGWSQEIHREVSHLHEIMSINDINRGLYVQDYDAIRKSDYYQTLKTKLKQGDLKGFEYFYYTMVTDEINTLELSALENLEEQFKYEEFLPNFNIVLAIRRWQEEKNPVRKNELNLRLREALNACNILPANYRHYLNLRGVNLAGADLGLTNLGYADLSGALLTHCNLSGARINGSCLDDAELSHSTLTASYMTDASAKHAYFDHVEVEGACWDNSNFSVSSFNSALINGVSFNNSQLDDCDFTDATLRMVANDQCTLRRVNLTGCTFSCDDPRSVKLWGETIFSSQAFASVSRFRHELDAINEHIMCQVYPSHNAKQDASSQRATYQSLVVGNLLDQLNHLSLSSDEKIALINAAIEHEIFMPEGYYSQLAYRAEKSIYGFFSTGSRKYFATDAVSRLEDARDSLLSNSIRYA
jgi:uncharacterized protein YjbI with pentapeptide repeats